MMSQTAPSAHAFRVADLPQNKRTVFDIQPGPKALQRIAADLDLSALRKLRFQGHIRAVGKQDWQLDGTLGATVVQPCTVTLDPVTTRIDAPVTRLFLTDVPDVQEEEIEMPEDDGIEALGVWIDTEAVMIEALSLEVPDYPRLDGAELGEATYTKPGETPMSDADARPFAGLAALRDQLGDDS